jgi:uncharacterized protein
MADYTATVASIYDAFRTGDIPAILETLADDVRWEEWTDNSAQKAGVPWLQRGDGKAGALEFFKIAGQMAIHEFRVLSLLAGGQQVVAEVVIDATAPSGRRYRDEELHLWTFNDAGQVVRLRHYVDTAKHIAASAQPHAHL